MNIELRSNFSIKGGFAGGGGGTQPRDPKISKHINSEYVSEGKN